MNILFITQYFPPETGAAQNRLSDLASRLAGAGHSVTVLTALPSYPTGRIFDGYRGRLWMKENQNGVKIVRTWLYTTKKKDFVSRMLNYLCFSISAFFGGLLVARGIDAIFVESPPLFLGVTGYVLSKLKHAKFLLNISDLWPESAVVLGMLHNRRLIELATRVEEGLYRRASLVTGQTQGIVSSIQSRVPQTRVVLLTNGIAPEFCSKVDNARRSRALAREEFGFGTKFIVAYAGVHGLAQGLDSIIHAARMLSSHKEILFVFFGDGPQKPHLRAMVTASGLANVLFFPPVMISRMPEVLAAVDVSIVPLKNDPLFRGALPSKLFETIGAGVPVIAAVDGEARRFVKESRGGLVVEPENPGELAEAILLLHGDAGLRQMLSGHGRTYVEINYNRKNIFERFEQLLLEIAMSGKSSLLGRPVSPSAEESHARRMELDLK
jgi:glycosyltransferase involved in cell wall biosynthesis